MEDKKAAKNSSEKNSFLSNLYLAIYNIVSSAGWLYLLYLVVRSALAWTNKYADLQESRNVYANVREPLKFLLATAFLEVVHAVVGLVKSNPAIVFVQCFIRFLVIWGVADVFQPV